MICKRLKSTLFIFLLVVLTVSISGLASAEPIINATINNTAPKFSDFINISANASDDIGLSTINWTINLTTGTEFNNYSVSGTDFQLSNSTQINETRRNVLNITFYVTDTSDNVAQNSTIIAMADSIGTISIGINSSSIRINDILNISGNITEPDGDIAFGWVYTNQTNPPDGINLTNDLSGFNANFSNTSIIVLVRGNVINFSVFYNDTGGNLIQDDTSLTVQDTIGTVSVGINNTAPKINEVVNASFNVTDADGLSFCLIKHNQSGSFVNSTFELSGTSGLCSDVITITIERDNVINFTVEINDSVGGIIYQNSTLITIVNTAPQINSFFPTENETIASQGGSQKFNVTFTDSDASDAPIATWLGNTTGSTTTIQSNSSNVTVDGLDVGIYNITVVVNDTAGASDSYEWRLNVTDAITGDGLTSPVLSLNETARQSATNVTINQTTFGGIDFGANTLNFSGVANLEDAFNISNGLISVDTDTFPGLNRSAFLVMKGLSFTKAPLIFTSSGFKSTANNASCPDTLCGDITYDTANGILRFNVTHFTTFFATTNTTNGAPTITSNAITTAALNEQYRYDVDATDPDGDTLTFSLATAPSGMSISSSSGLITFTPSSLGNFSVTVNVSDGNLSDSQSYNLTVAEGARLRITDLDIKVGTKSDKNVQNNSRISKEAEPGDKVEFDLEIKNFFTKDEGLEIEDIEVEITIEEIDDGDDLDDSASEFDLRAGRDDNVDIEFDVPLDVEEDVFDVLIEVEGRDENGTVHEIRWEVELEVEKQSHEIRVLRASATPSQVICQRTISINTEIINTGSKDEDEVTLEILSSALGISSVTRDIELDEGTDDNRFTKLITAAIDNDVAPGVYPVEINSYYDGKLSDSDTIDITVGQCELTRDVEEPVREQPRVVVTTPQPQVTEQPEQPIEISFVDTDLYFTLLAIMIVIFIGTAIFIIGAGFIVLRR